jgi:hypothetical protein
MHKKVLSEQSLYHGMINMPKDWDIDRNELALYSLESKLYNSEFRFSKTWDKLNCYIKDHFRVRQNLFLINKKTWSNIYKPNETSEPLLQINPTELKNSPDFILLYGVKSEDCKVTIYYDDNRRKGKTWTIPLIDNKFIMFPSSNRYFIKNNQKDNINFILTITYEYV